MRAPGLHRHGKATQRGAALMIMISILVVAIIAGLVGALSLSALNSARQAKTAAALAQAKDALIGKSIFYDDYPGSLPCPDTDNDGVSDAGGSTDCPNYIGRLPWMTLGLPDLRDAAGERLWYTLSLNFRRYDSVRPLNSNTKGTLDITGTQTASDLIAIVFAPGNILSTQSQSRSATQTAACTTTGTTVARSLCATNYLEGSNNNLSSGASPNTNYISADASDTFNDQLLFITTKDLMPLVEQRVAGEVKQALTNYYADHNYYPWADTVSGSVEYNANSGVNRGWLPYDATTGNTFGWGTSAPPPWFFDNEWYTLIYYSVAQNYTSIPGGCNYPYCDDSTLTVVDNNISPSATYNGVQVLFFMPGTPIPANIAPATNRAIDNLSHYLEDNENKTDPASSSADDNYVKPTSQDRDRDRLYWFSGITWKP